MTKKNQNMIGCIIQARMGSSRLPGKTLIKLNQYRTTLDFVVNQLSFSALLDKIDDFIAVSTHTNNAKKHNQTSMFQYLPEDQKVKTEINLNLNMNTTSKDKQLWELELLGLKLTINHQNEQIIKSVSDDYITSVEQINNLSATDMRNVKILGQTLSIEKLSL